VSGPPRWRVKQRVGWGVAGGVGELCGARGEGLRLHTKFSLEVHRQRMPIKDPAVLERHLAALRKTGLK